MRTKTLDDSTVAALSGSLSLSPSKYSKYFGIPRPVVAMASSLPWTARHLPFIGKHVVHWTEVKEHLENGCLNPAKIICEKEGLVAAFTNLTAIGEETNPVIKIWKERVDTLEPERRMRGAKFAAASTYYRTNESWERGCWSDIQPYLVDCLVDDVRECKSAKERLKPLAWRALKIGLEDLKDPVVGIHIVDVPHDIVWNAY